jgi:hypothetical protein
LEKPYYKFLTKDDNGKETLIGEDIYFTLRVLGEGFKPMCDTSVIASHYKPIFWGMDNE